eukprot:2389033-Prymnesium_polylepis.1
MQRNSPMATRLMSDCLKGVVIADVVLRVAPSRVVHLHRLDSERLQISGQALWPLVWPREEGEHFARRVSPARA